MHQSVSVQSFPANQISKRVPSRVESGQYSVVVSHISRKRARYGAPGFVVGLIAGRFVRTRDKRASVTHYTIVEARRADRQTSAQPGRAGTSMIVIPERRRRGTPCFPKENPKSC